MRQLAGQDVAEYLGVAVWVRGKAATGCDAVFVQDAEDAEAFEGRILVGRERKGVIAVQPAMIGMAAGSGAAGCYFHFGYE